MQKSTDEELNSVYEIANTQMKYIIEFAYLTGLRQKDILEVMLTDIKKEGVYVSISKTGNKILIAWNNRLKKLIDKITTSRTIIKSTYLFCTKTGKPYTSSGFCTIWQRLMRKAMRNCCIKERFRFHDIRRKTATDIEKIHGREQARKLLGHSDQKTTGVYISGVQTVMPLDLEINGIKATDQENS